MTKSPNRLLGVIFGAVYLLLGILGFTVTSGVGFFATQGGLLHIAHLLIGAALLIAGMSSVTAARTVNSVVGAAYLVLGLVGVFLVGTAINILALNVADNVLHFASAAVLLAAGLGADKPATVATA